MKHITDQLAELDYFTQRQIIDEFPEIFPPARIDYHTEIVRMDDGESLAHNVNNFVINVAVAIFSGILASGILVLLSKLY